MIESREASNVSSVDEDCRAKNNELSSIRNIYGIYGRYKIHGSRIDLVMLNVEIKKNKLF